MCDGVVGREDPHHGPGGADRLPLARTLAADNEVWGIARFSAAGSRDAVEANGVTTRVIDFSEGEFRRPAGDFTYVLHIAADFSDDDYDHALRVNAEGTGFC